MDVIPPFLNTGMFIDEESNSQKSFPIWALSYYFQVSTTDATKKCIGVFDFQHKACFVMHTCIYIRLLVSHTIYSLEQYIIYMLFWYKINDVLFIFN